MGSYRQIFYQIVFATKYREHTIEDEHAEELYKYICGIIKNKRIALDERFTMNLRGCCLKQELNFTKNFL